MPRRARIVLPNIPVHLIQRGNSHQPCFFADEDYRRYIDRLGEYAVKWDYHIHMVAAA
jgi:putative transposase